ncbi:hypothetical protein HanOQP8_Chr09g0311861 [Helianthus annuus]|nr:hypothetical protein HanOQP8_Chr09g0311861 [Helianthus annuus]
MISTVCLFVRGCLGESVYCSGWMSWGGGGNEELNTELKTFQTIAAELRCRVIDAEQKLLEEKERERAAWAEEKEELVAELKHLKAMYSVSQGDLNTMYANWGIAVDDNQKLAKERYWLIIEEFGSFLTAVS